SRTWMRLTPFSAASANNFSTTYETTSSLWMLRAMKIPANTFLSRARRVHIRQVELRELRMQLIHPFETSFGVTTERKIVIVKVDDGSQIGYGEVTAGEGPFYSHETYETAWHVLTEFIIPRTIGKEVAPETFASVVEGIRG